MKVLRGFYLILFLAILSCKINQQAATAGLKQALYDNEPAKVRRFLDKGANVNYKVNDRGWSPLFFASESGDSEIVRILLAHGADVNQLTIKKMSPLHRAASNGYLDIVETLLEHGADIDHQDSKLKATPLMMASVNGHVDVVRLLLSKDALVDVRGHRGESALFLAVSAEKAEVVKLLLDHGANKTRVDIYGKTCLEKAIELKNDEIINLLNQ